MYLSIIVPAYNEGKIIYGNLLEISRIADAFMKGRPDGDYEVIAVNDGSRDNTAAEAARAAAADRRIIAAGYEVNRGKGGAIKEGIGLAKGTYIAFLDADLELAPGHLKDFLDTAEKTGAAAVIGSKMHPDSKLDYPVSRRIISRCYYLFIRMLFHMGVNDTQTGVKLFRADTLKQVIGHVETCGYAYDIEILAFLHAAGGTIEERPVELAFTRKSGWSRIHMRDIMHMAHDTFDIHRRVKAYARVKGKHERPV